MPQKDKINIWNFLQYYPNAMGKLQRDDSKDIRVSTISHLLQSNNNSSIKSIKPILYPLKSMSYDQARLCATILWFDSPEDFEKQSKEEQDFYVKQAKLDIDDQFGGIKLPTYRIGFLLFHYLIQQNFDVFNLIAVDAALDATKPCNKYYA